MRYKADWDAAKNRLTAFWNREVLGRCCAAIYVYGKGCSAETVRRTPPKCEKERLTYWTDPEAIIARNRAHMERTGYYGEAFPQIFIDLGAAGHAGYFKGARYQFEDTVWFFPSLTDPDALEFDETSFLFERTLALARAFTQDSGGDYMVSMPDCTGNADALSHLMGPEALLTHMLEEPERVQEALSKIQMAYARAMREVYGIVRENNEGGSCVGWLSTWAPGFHAQMQSDMSVMISRAMFDQFIVPELTAQSELLEYPLYHFDGVEQIRHLDSLLAIPKLRAIQWTQVAGQRPCTDYIEELKRIQAAGKNLIILVSPAQIRPLMENLSSRGLYLITQAASEDEAQALLRDIAKWTRD